MGGKKKRAGFNYQHAKTEILAAAVEFVGDVPTEHARPMTTISQGSPPLLLTPDQVPHIQRPRTSWENAVCWTSTRTCGSGLRRGSMEDSYWQFRSLEQLSNKASCQPIFPR